MSIGVDTLRVGLPPGTPPIKVPAWGEWVEQHRPRCMVYDPGSPDMSYQARVNFQDRTTGIRLEQGEDGRGWLEGSLPKFVAQSAANGLPVPAGEVVDVVSDLVRSFGVEDPRLLPVRRLDVAGDWSGPVAPWRAAAMGWNWKSSKSIPQPDLWSVTIGRHGHNMLCLYDKGQESGAQPDRHGRCEVRRWKSLPFAAVAELGGARDWWISEVRKLDGDAPQVLGGSAMSQALIFAVMKYPDLVAPLEIILRNQGSAAAVTRFRRLRREALASRHALGDDLVQLCLAA